MDISTNKTYKFIFVLVGIIVLAGSVIALYNNENIFIALIAVLLYSFFTAGIPAKNIKIIYRVILFALTIIVVMVILNNSNFTVNYWTQILFTFTCIQADIIFKIIKYK